MFNFYFETCILYILDPPGALIATSFNITPSIISGGKFAILSCLADSIPAPTYEIRKDGVLLATGTEAIGVAFIYNISNAQFFDEGDYICNASNSLGDDSVTEFLDVTGKL